jgi:hypothetical protein
MKTEETLKDVLKSRKLAKIIEGIHTHHPILSKLSKVTVEFLMKQEHKMILLPKGSFLFKSSNSD